MAEEWIVHLRLRHNHGIQEYARELAVPVDIAFSSPRAVDNLRAGFLFGGFDEAVVMMKRRQIRREVLRLVATQLAEQMADSIEDAEGWHGPERQAAQNELRR